MTNLASLPLRGLILPRADGTFDPLGEIEPNAIEVDFLHVTDDGELIDSIAWHRDRPDIWWTHRDLVPVVGSYEISSSWWDHRPAYFVETPADFIACNGQAACIIDWTADVNAIIGEAESVGCQTTALAERMRRTLLAQARPPIVDHIHVAASTSRRAA
jgi:hypothetical protein